MSANSPKLVWQTCQILDDHPWLHEFIQGCKFSFLPFFFPIIKYRPSFHSLRLRIKLCGDRSPNSGNLEVDELDYMKYLLVLEFYALFTVQASPTCRL